MSSSSSSFDFDTDVSHPFIPDSFVSFLFLTQHNIIQMQNTIDFVHSFNDDDSSILLAYHSNLEDQNKDDYDFCTIVQQCSDPSSMLSLGEMTGQQRGLVYTVLSTIMSP